MVYVVIFTAYNLPIMKNLLIVANTPTDNTTVLAKAVVSGASLPQFESININFLSPLEASTEDVLNADGIIIGTTENFAYMSGLIKDFFERIYYPCLEAKQGMPYSLYIRAGNDGIGTKIAVEKILLGLSWRAVHDCTILKGEFKTEFTEQCKEIGMHMAAGLDANIF